MGHGDDWSNRNSEVRPSAKLRWWQAVPVLLAAIVFLVIVPALELNETHLLNPEWPAHARFHEAWQLLTNAVLGLAAVWCAFVARRARLAAGLLLMIAAPLLVASALGGTYGGSLGRPGDESLMMGGVSTTALVIALLGASLVAALLIRPAVGDSAPGTVGRPASGSVEDAP